MNAVERDAKLYMRAMMENPDAAYAIECRYGLDGYPPSVVSEWFAAEIKRPGSGDAAVDALFAEDR